MSYEVEHNIPKNDSTPQQTRRPDLSTFFSNLELVSTSATQNSNATPMPADMRAVFITLSDAFRSMRQEGGGSLLDTLIESLEMDADSPPREVQGVNDTFLDGMSMASLVYPRQKSPPEGALDDMTDGQADALVSPRARPRSEEVPKADRLVSDLW
ncbi:MAG: hypothetical protein Q9166_000053 [cf. Caloplaca sp. 2 TL-2023]